MNEGGMEERNGYNEQEYLTPDGIYIYKGNWKYNEPDDDNAKIVHPDGKIENINCKYGICNLDSEYMEKIEHKIFIGNYDYTENNEDLKDLKIEFSKEQQDAIKLYTKNGDVLLSLYLRSDRKFTFQLYYYHLKQMNTFKNTIVGYPFSLQNIEKFYQLIKTCFIYSFNRDVTVYRGISKVLEDVNLYDIQKSKTYVSTSLDMLPAYKFTLDMDQKHPYQLIKIIIPKGSNILPILNLSEYSDNNEYEILLEEYYFVCTKTLYKKDLEFITEIDMEPDYNELTTYQNLDDNKILTKVKSMNLIDFVYLNKLL